VLTKAEEFYLDWADETVKQAITRVSDALQRTGTLAVAMLGGSLYVVKDNSLPDWFRVPAMLLFLASTTAAYQGLFPREVAAERTPAGIQRYKAGVLDHRRRWLKFAAGLLWGGLWVATLGVLFRWVGLA